MLKNLLNGIIDFMKDEIRINATDKWDEGLPLGNGGTGSLVYGLKPLKITVDRTCEPSTMKGENTALYKPCTSKIAYERGRQNGCNEHKRLR